MTGARVGVPVPMVYGGIAAIIALLVAVGYFAGRASSGASANAPAAYSPAARAEDEGGRARADATAAAATRPPAASLATPAPPAAMTSAASPAAVAPPGATMPPAMRHAVTEYFRRMDATQSAAKTWSDPNVLAQEVLTQAMRGDSGGFDKLVAASAAARDGVRAIAPPTPCAEHHRLTLALLDEAVVILGKLRDGVAAGDPSAVAAIATSGRALEGRARAVDLLAATLKTQYAVEATQ